MDIPTFEFKPFNISDNYIVAPYIVIIPQNRLFKEIDENGEFDRVIANQIRSLLVTRYKKSYDLLKDDYIGMIFDKTSKNNTDIDSFVVIFIKHYSQSQKPVIFEIDETKNHEDTVIIDDVYKMFDDIYHQYHNINDVKQLEIKAIISDIDTLCFRFVDQYDNGKSISNDEINQLFEYVL